MGNIGEPKRVIHIPKPIKAPIFPAPVPTPTPTPAPVPIREPVYV